MHTESILEAEDVVLHPSGATSPVLNGASLVAQRGEYVAIMGSSGAGKSSFLYCLSGMEQPTSGAIRLAGTSIQALKEEQLTVIRRQVGFVFQQINLLPHLTLIENVALIGLLSEKKSVRAKAFDRAASLLTQVGIQGAANRHPSETSGGQQQRAAIARALMHEPEILFADEPTGALNSASGVEVLDLFDRVHNSGQTIVMVTHDPKAAARADRVVFMRDGTVLGQYLVPSEVDRERSLLNWLTSVGW